MGCNPESSTQTSRSNVVIILPRSTVKFTHRVSYQSLAKFFAHLCLFLQLIDIPVPADAVQVILEAYLQVLEVRPAVAPEIIC